MVSVASGRGKEKNGVKVAFANVQSIVNKVDEMRAMMTTIDPDVMAVTETWTHDGIGNEIMNINGYEIISRQDRNDTERGRGGGILIYVKKHMNATVIENNTNFNQCASIKMKFGGEDVKLHVVYRSPNSQKTNDDDLCNWIKNITGVNILIGDFNFPDVDWQNGQSGSKGRDFLDATMEVFLEQHVKEATHSSGNILDLVLCNQEGMITEVMAEGRVGKSDHDLILFTICVDGRRGNDKRRTPNYRKADFAVMRKSMADTNWSRELNGRDVNDMWVIIRDRIKELMERYVPMKTRKEMMQPPWMDHEVKKAIEKKKEAWKKWKESGSRRSKEEYKKKVTETKKKIRNKKNALERRMANCRKDDAKTYYAFINRTRKTRSKIGPLTYEGKEQITEPKEQAEVLNKYLASVFTESGGNLPAIGQYNGDARLSDIQIEEITVKNIIEKLNDQSASGPDGIPTRVIKEMKDELAKPLTMLFRKSLETGKIPDDWREANVTPIYKLKGSKSDPGSYRPVSLTNVIGKMMERVVKEELMNHVESKNLLCDAQHGFRAKRSPQTNLVEFLNETTKWMDQGKSFDILYLDFAKAFDKVCHKRLILKLEAAGIEGKVLEWLKDWLKGRKQRVRIDGEFSEWIEVLSSVVQGSVLGGTLFDIYINDIHEVVLDALIRMFADDTKVALKMESDDDRKKLQQIIDNLTEWADKWAMDFNTAKCKILHVGRDNPKYDFYMKGTKIKDDDEEKDLGVWVDATMKPTKQCAKAAKSANFALGQMQRAFHYRTKKNLVPIYKTFIRPKLEFSVAAWSPWMEMDKNVLEKVQERMIRLLSDAKGKSYEEKLRDVGLTTLTQRRERGDAIEAFKTLNGFNHVDKHQWFEIEDEEQRPTRRNTVIDADGEKRRKNVLRVEAARLEIRKNFYNVRAAKTWNQIPDEVREKKTVNGFKNAYDKWKEGKLKKKV